MENKEIKEIEMRFNVDLSDIYNQYPVPVGDICDKLGIQVVFDDKMGDDYHGNIKFENGEYIITINDNHSVHNNVFTIAHELGHFVKHHNEVRTKGFADRKKTKYTPQESKWEREANNFAASLLMPKNKFTEMFFVTNGSTSALQNMFRVSIDSIRYRSINLGLLLG